ILLRCARNQAALTVHYVRSEAIVVDFLQPANKKLQIHDRSDHAQEASAIHNWRADQHHRTRRLAATYYERLSVINPPIPSGSISALHFTVQNGAGSNSPGRDALDVRVEQRRIRDILGSPHRTAEPPAQSV